MLKAKLRFQEFKTLKLKKKVLFYNFLNNKIEKIALERIPPFCEESKISQHINCLIFFSF